jgi:HEAT repeat protein
MPHATGDGAFRSTQIYRILRLLQTSSPRFRAKLVRAAGLYWRYATFLNKILQDTDARVRANLIESLWNIDSRSARDIFRAAMWDTHHRVRTNALLGLYFMGESSAAHTLIEQARNSCPEQHMAAAWAMGQTTNERFRPILEILSTDDSVEAVRDRALASLSGLSKQQAASTSLQQPIQETSNALEEFENNRESTSELS